MSKDKKPKVFVIMPFGEEFWELYGKLKKDFDDYDFTNAADLDNQQNILQDIVKGIADADVVIADLTGLNSNVFYELGLAHAMNKKVIIITQNFAQLPFDIKSYRANEYSMLFYKIDKLFAELKKLLKGAIDGSIKYGNPVSDYLPSGNVSKNDEKNNAAQSANKPDFPSKLQSDKTDVKDALSNGYLDIMDDIKTNISNISGEIILMADEMEEMKISIESTTEEINLATAKNVRPSPSIVRNFCRNLSMPIDKFASKLKVHNEHINDNWNLIENGFLNLIDTPVITGKYSDKIKNEISNLKSLQLPIKESNDNIMYLINSLKSCLGLESKLSSSALTLISELENYLSMMDRIASSIDRIDGKGALLH